MAALVNKLLKWHYGVNIPVFLLFQSISENKKENPTSCAKPISILF